MARLIINFHLDVVNPAARLPRIEFPAYNGFGNFRSWKSKVEQYFELYQMPELQKMRTIYFHLFGPALDWHGSFMEDNRGMHIAWDQYMYGMGLRFDRQQLGDPMLKLKELLQTGSVEQYRIEFEKLRGQTRCDECQALSMFLGGLKHNLKKLVAMGKPITVLDAYNLAKLFEEVLLEDDSLLLKHHSSYSSNQYHRNHPQQAN